MQVQQLVNTELVGRLKIGGRWFGPGSVVALDKNDVDILEMRGISRKPPPGAEPLNVEKPKPAEPVKEVVEEAKAETIPAAAVPVQTKDTEETDEQKAPTNGTPFQSRKPRR
jgi:hypothetical protein